MHWIDWVVLGVVAVLFALSIGAQWRKRKKGGSSCGSCGGCPMAGQCGAQKQKAENAAKEKH